MIYTDQLTAPKLKHWIAKTYGRATLAFIAVRMHHSVDGLKDFCIRSYPGLLKRTIYIWVFDELGECDKNGKDIIAPDGKIDINPTSLGGFHTISTWRNFYKKLQYEVNALYNEIIYRLDHNEVTITPKYYQRLVRYQKENARKEISQQADLVRRLL